MARPLRITFPGAFYHVTSRGNERKAVFKSKRDREKFLEYFEDELNQLDEIKQDKLLDISEHKIEVLLAGRFFIRNICSVFDRYNQTGKPTNQYSKMI